MKKLLTSLVVLACSSSAFAAENLKFGRYELYIDGTNNTLEIIQQADGRYTFSKVEEFIDWANSKLGQETLLIDDMSCTFGSQSLICSVDKRYVDGPKEVVEGVRDSKGLWNFTLTSTSSGQVPPVTTIVTKLGDGLSQLKK